MEAKVESQADRRLLAFAAKALLVFVALVALVGTYSSFLNLIGQRDRLMLAMSTESFALSFLTLVTATLLLRRKAIGWAMALAVTTYHLMAGIAFTLPSISSRGGGAVDLREVRTALVWLLIGATLMLPAVRRACNTRPVIWPVALGAVMTGLALSAVAVLTFAWYMDRVA